MQTKPTLLVVLLLAFTLFGCTNERGETVSTSANPTAEEILTADPTANVFQWKEIIYETDIDWVEELELQEDKIIGEIEVKVSKANEFKNGAANQLPIGAKIYSVKGHHDILVVKYAEQTKRYLALVEG